MSKFFNKKVVASIVAAVTLSYGAVHADAEKTKENVKTVVNNEVLNDETAKKIENVTKTINDNIKSNPEVSAKFGKTLEKSQKMLEPVANALKNSEAFEFQKALEDNFGKKATILNNSNKVKKQIKDLNKNIEDLNKDLDKNKDLNKDLNKVDRVEDLNKNSKEKVEKVKEQVDEINKNVDLLKNSLDNSNISAPNENSELSNNIKTNPLNKTTEELSLDLKDLESDTKNLEEYLKLIDQFSKNIDYDKVYREFIEYLNLFSTQDISISKKDNIITERLEIAKNKLPEMNKELLTLSYSFSSDEKEKFDEDANLRLDIIDKTTGEKIYSNSAVLLMLSLTNVFGDEVNAEVMNDLRNNIMSNYPALADEQKKQGEVKCDSFLMSMGLVDIDKFENGHAYQMNLVDEKNNKIVKTAFLKPNLQPLSEQVKNEAASFFVNFIKGEIDFLADMANKMSSGADYEKLIANKNNVPQNTKLKVSQQR